MTICYSCCGNCIGVCRGFKIHSQGRKFPTFVREGKVRAGVDKSGGISALAPNLSCRDRAVSHGYLWLNKSEPDARLPPGSGVILPLCAWSVTHTPHPTPCSWLSTEAAGIALPLPFPLSSSLTKIKLVFVLEPLVFPLWGSFCF